jgi:WbqC-like protein family
MVEICLSMAYLGPVEYYQALGRADTILLEQCENYEKQSYRNRCNIAGSNGVLSLSIPVEKASGEKVLTRDIRISEHGDWQLQHWKSIEAAYNSTPFFEYYKDDLVHFYHKKWDFLWDFNLEIQSTILELLELEPTISFSTEYKVNLDENYLDLRQSIHPKKENQQFSNKSYYQVFEQRFGFQPNLSIIDLLFNMGNESQLIIQNA